MRIPSTFVAPWALAILLSSCSNDQGASQPKPVTKTPVEVTACGAEKLGKFVGQQATPNILSEIQKTVGHDRIRTLDPKSIVTMDFQEDRLNVDTDTDGKILRARCG